MLPHVAYPGLDCARLRFQRQSSIMSLMQLLLLHLGPSSETHLRGVACKSSPTPFAGTCAAKPGDGHTIRDTGPGQSKGIDIRVRISRGESRVAAEGGWW